ncbi:hypothetical protein AC1031_014915 [Aphanomyces cochlioides]|nr:hypothetical protein AC1031_014915 [Aphanomyces cochlioides]
MEVKWVHVESSRRIPRGNNRVQWTKYELEDVRHESSLPLLRRRHNGVGVSSHHTKHHSSKLSDMALPGTTSHSMRFHRAGYLSHKNLDAESFGVALLLLFLVLYGVFAMKVKQESHRVEPVHCLSSPKKIIILRFAPVMPRVVSNHARTSEEKTEAWAKFIAEHNKSHVPTIAFVDKESKDTTSKLDALHAPRSFQINVVAVFGVLVVVLALIAIRRRRIQSARGYTPVPSL